LIAQFDFEKGKCERGILHYRTIDTAAGVRECYHRQFLRIEEEAFFSGSLTNVFLTVDQDVESHKERQRLKHVDPAADKQGMGPDGGSVESAEIETRLPHIEIDPLLGLIKIHDESNGLVISIFRLPSS
jgi:hypothetical protein